LPYALNLWHQDRIPLDSGALQLRIPLLRGITAIIGRGNLQYFAKRLDPVRFPMLVNELPYDLKRRSSSAWAKNALASFKISLARRSSLTSYWLRVFQEWQAGW